MIVQNRIKNLSGLAIIITIKEALSSCDMPPYLTLLIFLFDSWCKAFYASISKLDISLFSKRYFLAKIALQGCFSNKAGLHF
ncbi:MAG: hypothetical protein KAG28_01470, partial [Cocleimonas sp.]|nr:hypothetical protein [Cocleimonas sp.]